MGKMIALLFLSGGLCIVAPAALQFRAVGSPRPHRSQLLQNSHQGPFEIATSSTFQVSYPVAPGFDERGSGVWVSKEGYVATCWHVIRDATGPVIINISLATYEKNLIVNASFQTMVGHVVAHDEATDVAILKVDNNPFTNPPIPLIMFEGQNKQVTARFAVPEFRQQLPDSGEQIVLSGFPLGRPDLISQAGVVAGIGIPSQIPPQADLAKLVRVFASAVSNPANSGGPVFDSSGKLIGILEGNLQSPMIDEQGRYVEYFRPRRDPNGNPISDQSGNVQNEIAHLDQNSGISVVIPVEFVTSALKEALAIVSASTPEQVQRMAPRPTPYSTLPNQELQTATLNLVSDIRQLLGNERLAENRLSIVPRSRISLDTEL